MSLFKIHLIKNMTPNLINRRETQDWMLWMILDKEIN